MNWIPGTSKYGKTLPNKHGGVGRQQQQGRLPIGIPRRTWLESVEAKWKNLRSTEKMSMTGRNGEIML